MEAGPPYPLRLHNVFVIYIWNIVNVVGGSSLRRSRYGIAISFIDAINAPFACVATAKKAIRDAANCRNHRVVRINCFDFCFLHLFNWEREKLVQQTVINHREFE